MMQEALKFYWIGLKVVRAEGDAIFLKGPYNTERGRNKELLNNQDQWVASKVEFRPFETMGKHRADANETARQVLNQADTPQERNGGHATPQVLAQRFEGGATVPSYIPNSGTPNASNQVSNEIIAQNPSIDDAENVLGNTAGLVEIANLERQKAIGDTIGPEDANAAPNTNPEAIIGEISLQDVSRNAHDEAFNDLESEYHDAFAEETNDREEATQEGI